MPQGSLDFQVIELPGGIKARAAIELDRPWACLTVVWMPQAMFAFRDNAFDGEPIYRLHLTEGDEGIPITHAGQRIRLPAHSRERVYWTSRFNYGSQRALIVASDAIGIDFAGDLQRPFHSSDGGAQTYQQHASNSDHFGAGAIQGIPDGAACFVWDTSVTPNVWRALTPDDFGAAAGGDELATGGTSSFSGSAIVELIAAPGAGFRIVLHGATIGATGSSNVMQLQDDAGTPNVYGAAVGNGGVVIPGGSRVLLPENQALDLHNEVGSTTQGAWAIVYTIEAV